MQRLRHAFRFIGASFKLALTHPQLLRPLLFLGVGSLLLLILWFIPLASAVGLVGLNSTGLVLIGILSIFSTASLLIWGEIAALQLCPAAAELLQNPSQEFSPALNSLKAHWGDILLFVLASPWIAIFRFVRKLLKREAQTTTWFDARDLILPVVSLENLKLAQAIGRVAQMLKDNLIRFQSSLVRVRLIAKSVQWILLVGGATLGTFIAISLADPVTAPLWLRILAVFLGLLSAWFLTTIGILFSTFTRTCYHTSLYIWVRNVERSRRENDPGLASPPDILRKVLGTVK